MKRRRLALATLVLLSLTVGSFIAVRSMAAPMQLDGKPAAQLNRAGQADAERYTALAEYHNKFEEARQRALLADAARWNAQAKHYNRSPERPRAIKADQIRLEGLARYYLALEGASQLALDAYAARLTALAEYYRAIGK